jgi:protein-L-isoaspartate(D-aspartate) O-methyltransferase
MSIVRTLLLGFGLTIISLLTACASPATPTAVDAILPPTPADEVETKELSPSPTAAPEDPYQRQRDEMVEEGIVGWGITDPAVIEVMGRVPRHEFVPEEFLSQAYNNHPLPIGYGQTISQPYIVALMTEALEVTEEDRVLEIGTGSGYQAAVLAELVDHVYTIEIVGPLAKRAESTLARLGYDNVTVRHADGYFGWEEQAPFDAIIVTAAPDHIPQPLVDQLKIDGRLIIPVGPVGGFQTLWLVTRVSEDEVQTENLGGVRFVPLTREEG